jgi:hypothetical protein
MIFKIRSIGGPAAMRTGCFGCRTFLLAWKLDIYLGGENNRGPQPFGFI